MEPLGLADHMPPIVWRPGELTIPATALLFGGKDLRSSLRQYRQNILQPLDAP